ncbi:MAG: ABC transporter substrate-binding protein [Celeribacter sp.]|jgi:peptide/nickel transport system substrate-binding protein
MTQIKNHTHHASLSRRGFLGSAAATGLALVALPGAARAAAEGPKYGGAFVVGAGVEPRHLNQNIVTDSSIKLISNPIFSKLVGLKSDLSPKPDLATDWTISDDGMTYEFNLHDGVKWHDGTAFSSADVKFSFEDVLFKFHNVGRGLAKFVNSIETPDDTTVVFKLNAPNDVMMTFIAGQGFIQAKHIYEGSDPSDNPSNLAPVGTGPFRFVEWQRGQHIVLERNEDYFVEGQPYVHRIITSFIPEASARIRALEAGEVDYVTYADLPPSMITGLQNNPDITVTSEGHEAWGSITELMMNLDNAPFDDKRVRMAVDHALDIDFIIDKAVFGLAKAATGPVSSELAWAYTPDTKQYKYDVEAAKALLDEAGYPDSGGTRFETSVIVNRANDAFVKAAQIVAEQLRGVGIQVEVKALDAATVAETVYVKRDFGMYIQSLTTGPDPAMGVQRQYVSSNIRPVPYTNGIGYRNDEIDEIFAKAAASADREERATLYKQASKILCDDCALVWLYENPTYSAYASTFGNLHSWAAESIYSYGDVFWKEGENSRG